MKVETHVLPQAKPCSLDKRIVAVLWEIASRIRQVRIEVGFRNEEGVLYRRATLHSPWQLAELLRRLGELGLKAGRLAAGEAASGLVAVFQPQTLSSRAS